MKRVEDVQLTGLDRPPSLYTSLAAALGYEVKDLGDSVIAQGSYELGRYERLLAQVHAVGSEPRVFRSVGSEFEDADFIDAELLGLSFAELDVMGFYEKSKCESCGRRPVVRDFTKRVARVKTKHKVVMVGVWALVVHRSVKQSVEGALRGGVFHPFDQAGEYYYLTAARELEQQVIRAEDGINIRNACPSCGRIEYDVFFGPLRYRREGWNGDDVSYSYFMDTLVFTQRAYELLLSFEHTVKRSEPVVLE
jgi:hypothetical protein